jgi:hypothetical protein
LLRPFRLALLLPLLLLLACPPPAPTPLESYQAGSYEQALEAQRIRASTPGVDQTLETLRFASMALAQGQPDLAEKALRVAVPRMQSFEADGEWQAVLGVESSKEWKGEPYEKMAAFLTLGTLLYARGDLGNALAMFKSAVLADTGTAEERYRSDFLPAWVMQSLCYRALGEDANARQAATLAVDGLYSREVVEILADTLRRVEARGDAKALAVARLAIETGLPAGVGAAPRDPDHAARATLSHANDLLRVQVDKPRKERMPAFGGLSSSDLRAGLDGMGPLGEAWRRAVQALPHERLAGIEARAAALEALLERPPGVMLLVEQGIGPRKRAEGRYGEQLVIVSAHRDPPPPEPRVGDQPLAALWLDSLTFQATTRGGRKVDAFLRGKAVFKDASMIGGQVLMQVGEAARNADNPQAAAAVQLVGLGVWVAGLATNPAADTREWGLLPDHLYLVAADLPPGDHALRLLGRSYVLHVPESGRLFALIPRLAPGGASEIGTR